MKLLMVAMILGLGMLPLSGCATDWSNVDLSPMQNLSNQWQQQDRDQQYAREHRDDCQLKKNVYGELYADCAH